MMHGDGGHDSLGGGSHDSWGSHGGSPMTHGVVMGVGPVTHGVVMGVGPVTHGGGPHDSRGWAL